MLSLDFKLTSGQVRALLYIYALERTSAKECRESLAAPETAFFNTSHFITSVDSLKRKGLVVHNSWPNSQEYALNHEQYGHALTDDGRACAQLIISQSRHIAALAAFVDARNAKRKAVKKRTPISTGAAHGNTE